MDPLFLLDSSEDEAPHASSSRVRRPQGHGRHYIEPRITALYRCRVRPNDFQIREPYTLVQEPSIYENGRLAYSCNNDHFHVRESTIYIDASDASPDEPQNRTTATKGFGTIHSQVIPVPEHDKTRQEWLSKIGELIAAVMFAKSPKNRHNRPFKLARFPDNMIFYRRAKTNSTKPETRQKPRSDVYLQNTSSSVYRTPQEFARHAMWLMDGKPHDAAGRTMCLCKFCDRRDNLRRPGKTLPGHQRPITKDLYIVAGFSMAEAEIFSREASVESEVDELEE
ncbi:hypothetical protein PENSPDRAFT_658121 [Peniophora sp. CONT]|nr:hypothetical protein PENSPDRAFT_658121 [Peniophora sp. CONT]